MTKWIIQDARKKVKKSTQTQFNLDLKAKKRLDTTKTGYKVKDRHKYKKF